MNTLPLYFSPCPNDTFCFHAMVFGLIDTEGLSFEPLLEDVEQLNQRVFTGNPEICKISYHLFPKVADRYRMLPCGSALGYGNGPLFVSKTAHLPITQETRIAIPGVHTTAAFLLKFAYPQVINTSAVPFSDITNAILRNEYDAGVLIHEGRFVYEQQGLHLIADLGMCWEERTGLPIPLGGIAVSRTLSDKVQQKIARILYRSIQHALAHPSDSWEYVQNHARELDSKVIRKHIELFVNDDTLDIGTKGRLAVKTLFDAVHPPQYGTDFDVEELSCTFVVSTVE